MGFIPTSVSFPKLVFIPFVHNIITLSLINRPLLEGGYLIISIGIYLEDALCNKWIMLRLQQSGWLVDGKPAESHQGKAS